MPKGIGIGLSDCEGIMTVSTVSDVIRVESLRINEKIASRSVQVWEAGLGRETCDGLARASAEGNSCQSSRNHQKGQDEAYCYR